MSRIGAFEAKTHLPRLLRRVQAGERFVITRHNQPIAELIPFQAHNDATVRAAIADLKDFQRTHSLGGLSIREMIEEGRKR
ncbi:MAG: type II toxin-antitoxin system prevent-host-death family antitoxin [Gemmatimonadetes bacterium]|nr:type II toxin-antitoxin system prevent-host-death family antitoxin [Gemmatimonadota bacterium]MDE2677206.1 type II toxin-antitoxin system prevent-host-death family antitoxin [Gemmatimonadota bacterium]MYA11809.1 type II toxin-antitoxin system prevent-host-death family antitoxin [Gemmatimonadota bacterium]MYD14339.1 type II toxin-antitoxin system prevent-host-death family antitoxin [Gemmatimonadota bacterium]MYE70507.1 type II toxin-antitoxin system prevent-host-death family antitoxin [Gemmat